MYLYIIIAFIIASWFLRRLFTPVYLAFKFGYLLFRNPVKLVEFLGVLQDAYPDIFRVPLTFKRYYYIAKPEYYEKILSSPHAMDKAKVYSYLEEFCGPNIFTASGSLFEVRHKFDVETHIREQERLLSDVARRGVRSFYEWFGFTSSISKEFEESWNYAQSVGKKIISERQKQIAENKELLEDGKLYSERTRKTCMLENMLERPEFTEERTMSEILLFIIAGNETSASALLFTFIALALNPNIQERLYEEVVNICGLDGPVTLEQLPHIEYADRIIKETLRIFPVAPFLGRHIQEDLDIGNKVLPKDSTVFLNLIHTHRNPKYWREPLKFDPDRFLQENSSKIYPFSYIPFSQGSRNCIGSRYAMTSLKITLITVTRKAKIFTDYKTIEEIKLKSHFTLRPLRGWNLRLEARS